MVSKVVQSAVAVTRIWPWQWPRSRAWRQMSSAAVVLPVPGGPVRMMCLPKLSAAVACSITLGRITNTLSTRPGSRATGAASAGRPSGE